MKVTVFDKIIERLDDTNNAVHKYYAEDKPEKKGTHFCHHQVSYLLIRVQDTRPC